MTKSIKAARIKKATVATLALLMTVVPLTPAHAQFAIFNPADFFSQLEQGASNFVQSLGQLMQTKAQQNMVDTQIAAGRVDKQAAAAEQLAIDSTNPTTQTFCPLAGGAISRGQSAAANGATGQAMTQSAIARYASMQETATSIAAACDSSLNFAPRANVGGPEAAAYSNLGSSCNSSGANAGMDMTPDAIFGSMEIKVPTKADYPGPLNGTYAEITHISDQASLPFAAALRYCLHVAPLPPAPPMPAAGSQPQLASLAIASYGDAKRIGSTATSQCFNSFIKRMKFGSDVAGSSASTPDAAKGLQKQHVLQIQQCELDNKANLLDDDKLATCETDGRSELQAEYDRAYRLGSIRFQNYLQTLKDSDNRAIIINDALNAEAEFDRQLDAERGAFNSALVAARTASAPATNQGLNQTVKSQ